MSARNIVEGHGRVTRGYLGEVFTHGGTVDLADLVALEDFLWTVRSRPAVDHLMDDDPPVDALQRKPDTDELALGRRRSSLEHQCCRGKGNSAGKEKLGPPRHCYNTQQ